MKKVRIVGASGKLGQYIVRRALARRNKVAGACRERSIGKLDAFMVWDTINNKASW